MDGHEPPSQRLDEMPSELLLRKRDELAARYQAFAKRGLKLDLTRGKPAPEQLGLSEAIVGALGTADLVGNDGTDYRNYGGLDGVPAARRLLAPLLGVPAEQLVVAGNSSLALMHDAVVYLLLHGAPGGAPWRTDPPVTFLCPSPGYDRHFAICESFGINMVPVPLTGHGPDMDVVERLVAEDPSVKAMWCVPKYSNPTGDIYSPETVERLATMTTAAPDFRLFWDNAYAVHHLTTTEHEIADILEASARRGHPDRPLVFGSTSKVTLAGAGLAAFGGSKANHAWYTRHMSKRTIGPDKINQLRHIRFLGDHDGIRALMARHRALLAPKFAAVEEAFETLLGQSGLARWTRPEGGYFISLDVRPGTAKRVVALSEAAGVAVTPAGSTYPYGRDPNDGNIRIAPSFPSITAIREAAEGVALATLLAGAEAVLAERQ